MKEKNAKTLRKKLALTKESLKHLTSTELTVVVGGEEPTEGCTVTCVPG